MTDFQKIIKYVAMGLAVCLAVYIIGCILSLFGLIGFISDRDAVTNNVTPYTVSSDISSLNISVNAAELVIEEGESFSVESNLKDLKVTEKNGTLTIKEDRRFGTNYNSAVLTLCVPKETVFEKVIITTGAGKFTADVISAERMNLTLGAGEVNIKELNSLSSAEIEGGAGKISISGGNLQSVDFSMGIGQFDLTAYLTGECEFDLGIGESNISLLGERESYELEVSKGVGNVTVNGESFGEIESLGEGKNKIEINGGIGEINLTFEEN